MSKTQIQLKNVEEIEHEYEFGEGKLMVDLGLRITNMVIPREAPIRIGGC
jgi:hypothetical protein